MDGIPAKNQNSKQRAEHFMPTDCKAKQILDERALILAKEQQEISDKDLHIDYIKFRLGGFELYGIAYEFIREVIDHVHITPIPRTHMSVTGVINKRGGLITILDLKHIFSIQHEDSNKQMSQEEQGSIIIVEVNDITVGILTDEIVGSDAYDVSDITNHMPYDGVINSKFVSGLHNNTTSILNMPLLIAEVCRLIQNKE